MARLRCRPGGVLLAVLAVSAAALSGCGAGAAHGVASLGSTTTKAPPSQAGSGAPSGLPPPAKGGQLLEEFAACMRAHGVVGFPSPIISANSVELRITPQIAGSPHFASAQSACQHLLPAGAKGPNITTAQQADYLKAAQCMRDHGIEGFPDPDFKGGDVRFPLPAGMNANSHQFEAARAVCSKLIPPGLPYSSGSN